MTSAGSAIIQLRRAIRSGDLLLVRAAAAGTRVDLEDAFAILLLIGRQEPDRYDAALVRWVSRLCRERPAIDAHQLALVSSSLAALPTRPVAAGDVLGRVFGELRLERARTAITAFAVERRRSDERRDG
jgi:hypothetical protein